MIRCLLTTLLVAIPAAARSAEFDPRQTPNRTPALIARVVAYVITLERCALIKPGRNARALGRPQGRVSRPARALGAG